MPGIEVVLRQQFFKTYEQEPAEQSTVLLGHKSLQRATESIARSQMVSSENEAVGNNILNDLGEQREQLHRTRDRVQL